MIIAKHVMQCLWWERHTHTHRDTDIQSYTYIYSFKHIREKTGQPIERADIVGKGETMRKKHSHNPKFGNGRQKVKYRRLNCYRIKKNCNNNHNAMETASTVALAATRAGVVGHDHRWKKVHRSWPAVHTFFAFFDEFLEKWALAEERNGQEFWMEKEEKSIHTAQHRTATVQKENYATQQKQRTEEKIQMQDVQMTSMYSAQCTSVCCSEMKRDGKQRGAYFASVQFEEYNSLTFFRSSSSSSLSFVFYPHRNKMNYPTNEEITQNKRQRWKKLWREKEVEEQKIWRLNNGENGKLQHWSGGFREKEHANA